MTAFTEHADETADWLDGQKPPENREALVDFAVAADNLARAAKAVADSAKRALGEAIAESGEDRWTVNGHVVEGTVRKPRKDFDRDRCVSAVLAYAQDERRVNEETGEIESRAEAQLRVLLECFRAEPRMTPIRDLGLDPDVFYGEVGEPVYGVRFVT